MGHGNGPLNFGFMSPRLMSEYILKLGEISMFCDLLCIKYMYFMLVPRSQTGFIHPPIVL